MYDAVVFDNDGVLLDLTGMDTHREGAREAFAAAGVDDPRPEDIEAMSMGVTVPDLHAVCDRYELDPDGFWSIRDRVMAEKQQALIRAGEKSPYDDIGLLEELSCPLGVVSSNQQATVAFAYEFFELDRHFETVQARPPTVESIRRKKPEPHYLERALADLPADRPLFVGDNESDVKAAHAAGIDAAFIRRPHRRDTDLSVTPEHDIDGLGELHTLMDDDR